MVGVSNAVIGAEYLVEVLPNHGHHEGFPRAGGHLETILGPELLWDQQACLHQNPWQGRRDSGIGKLNTRRSKILSLPADISRIQNVSHP